MEKKKILVTGSEGQLGRAVAREFQSDSGYELILTDMNTERSIDITDLNAVTEALLSEKPCAVINCAAYTAVDKQEKDQDLAYRINALGPRNLSIASAKAGAKLVHISTDYVFPGNADRPYIEFDATGPVSVYGKTKLAGEEFVKQFSKEYFIIRTAWLYGEGNNFVRTMLRLSESKEELNVVSDQLGTPTSASELAKCIHALLPTEEYGLYHGTCEGDTNWASFAERIFELGKRKTKVNRVSSEEYAAMNPASAKRPAYSILDNYMLRLTGVYTFADWEEALEQYFKEGFAG